MESNNNKQTLTLHPEIVTKKKIFSLTDLNKRKMKIVCTLGYVTISINKKYLYISVLPVEKSINL